MEIGELHVGEVSSSTDGSDIILELPPGPPPSPRTPEFQEPSVLGLLNACPRCPEERGRLDVLRGLVRAWHGWRLDIGWPYGEVMTVTDPAEFGVDFDVGRLYNFPCVRRDFCLIAFGLVQPCRLRTEDGGPQLVLVSSGGGRIYAYSSSTDTLYIVARDGLGDLLEGCRGLRNVAELYDVPPLGLQDEMLEFDYECSPIVLTLLHGDGCTERVLEFLHAFPRLVCDSCGDPDDYFVFGDEKQLDLIQYFPSRVFHCLRVAGYRVLGQGYRLSVVVFDPYCRVFVLLRDGRLLKVSETIRGFIRGRFRIASEPRRVIFSTRYAEGRICVGETVTFPCDVKYALQDDEPFYRRFVVMREALRDRCDGCELELLSTP